MLFQEGLQVSMHILYDIAAKTKKSKLHIHSDESTGGCFGRRKVKEANLECSDQYF